MKTVTHVKLWILLCVAFLIGGVATGNDTLMIAAFISTATAAIISEIGEAKAANHTQGEG